MQNHIVIGAGNLGQDLKLELERKGHRVLLISQSNGFRWPSHSFVYQFDKELGLDRSEIHTVWCAVGSGSVKEAKENYQHAIDINLALPLHLMKTLDVKTKIVLFTSDYAMKSVDHIRSLYALSKAHMEEMVHLHRRPNVMIYRVGSLYGTHKPLQTFPGKIIFNHKDFGFRDKVRLPKNPCHPTPTDWLAEQIVAHQDRKWINSAPCEVFPRDIPNLSEWAGAIIGNHLVHEINDYDPERPREFPWESNQTIGNLSENQSWKILWNDRKESMMKAIRNEIDRLGLDSKTFPLLRGYSQLESQR